MNQAKTKRPFNGGQNNKTPRHTGPKLRVVDLRAKDAHTETLVEMSVEALKRFYKTVDALRLGNYKTGFNTYQYGLVIVEGFTVHRAEAGDFTEVMGTLFGLVKADDFTRLASSKAEPALADYEQAIFIEDNGGIYVEGNETKVALTKFRAVGDSKRLTVAYRSIEQFSAVLIEELFALDILPQFRKDLSDVVAKQETRLESRQEPKPATRPQRTDQRRPMRKSAEPIGATA